MSGWGEAPVRRFALRACPDLANREKRRILLQPGSVLLPDAGPGVCSLEKIYAFSR
jgi:hypothetical protein